MYVSRHCNKAFRCQALEGQALVECEQARSDCKVKHRPGKNVEKPNFTIRRSRKPDRKLLKSYCAALWANSKVEHTYSNKPVPEVASFTRPLQVGGYVSEFVEETSR